MRSEENGKKNTSEIKVYLNKINWKRREHWWFAKWWISWGNLKWNVQKYQSCYKKSQLGDVNISWTKWWRRCLRTWWYFCNIRRQIFWARRVKELSKRNARQVWMLEDAKQVINENYTKWSWQYLLAMRSFYWRLWRTVDEINVLAIEARRSGVLLRLWRRYKNCSRRRYP